MNTNTTASVETIETFFKAWGNSRTHQEGFAFWTDDMTAQTLAELQSETPQDVACDLLYAVMQDENLRYMPGIESAVEAYITTHKDELIEALQECLED